MDIRIVQKGEEKHTLSGRVNALSAQLEDSDVEEEYEVQAFACGATRVGTAVLSISREFAVPET
jgi:hypothetical protein